MLTTPFRNTTRRALHPIAWAAALAALGCNDRAPAQPNDPPADHDQIVSRLEGVWAGNDNKTPFGPMPFGFSFERQTDGALHARTSNPTGFYVDLRFAKDQTARWLLTEEAAIPGRGSQTHTLAADSLAPDLLVFRDVDKPDDLQVRIQLAGTAMVFQVMWRGQEHVLFHLNRLEGAAADRARQRLAGAASP
jgi:hypothetical protein